MLSSNVLCILAALVVSGVVAAPWDPTSRHTTHRVRTVGPNKVKLTTYHPPGVFETYGAGVDRPLSKRGTTNPEIALDFLKEKFGLTAEQLSIRSSHERDGVWYGYCNQKINNVTVSNAVGNVAIKNGKVVSYGANFVKPKSIAPAQTPLPVDNVISLVEGFIGDGKYNGWPVRQEYVVTDADHAAYTHVIQIQNSSTGEWYQMYADAFSGKVLNTINYVADASYLAVPLTSQDPTQNYSNQTDPADKTASPKGWHTIGNTMKDTTSGNNAISYKAPAPVLLPGPTQETAMESTTTKQSSATNNYYYPYNSASPPVTGPNVNAGRVNAFYVVNIIHDLTYKYGFTEKEFNFQKDNGDKGGVGNDRVQISVQDVGGTNNANFATPVDGQPGQMRMYLWTYTIPFRDGALENDIVVHEFTHGVSNRLTGGGTGQCLQTTEAGGMGEGWSDAMADITEAKMKPHPDFTLGEYVINKVGGIRSYPYSTSKDTNPLTYGSLASKTEVHDIGEVWANMLHNVLAALIDRYGVAQNLFNENGTEGNVVALHLMMDGFKLQSCNPTFLTARDAIIQADTNRYNGANKCLLWGVFASRGLGEGATGTKADNMAVPSECSPQ